jgi:hypothetical protein
MEHLRVDEVAERSLERRPPVGCDVTGRERVADARVVTEFADDFDQVGVLEEDQATGVVVVRERAERLRS